MIYDRNCLECDTPFSTIIEDNYYCSFCQCVPAANEYAKDKWYDYDLDKGYNANKKRAIPRIHNRPSTRPPHYVDPRKYDVKKTCLICKDTFMALGKNHKYCSECAKKRAKERSDKYNANWRKRASIRKYQLSVGISQPIDFAIAPTGLIPKGHYHLYPTASDSSVIQGATWIEQGVYGDSSSNIYYLAKNIDTGQILVRLKQPDHTNIQTFLSGPIVP